MSEDTKTVELLREISIQCSKDPEYKKRAMRVILGDAESDVKRAFHSGQKPSYYQEKFARELQPRLDEMIADHEDIEFRFTDYPRINKHTLYLKVYWAWLYLRDELDPDGKYQKLYNDTQLSKNMRTGVRIVFVDNKAPLHAHKLRDISKPAFREKIDKFLEEGKEGEVLELTKISLGDTEVSDLRTLLTSIENLVWIVTGTRVKLMKVNEEQYKAWLSQT